MHYLPRTVYTMIKVIYLGTCIRYPDENSMCAIMVVSGGGGEDQRLTRKECSAGICRCPVFRLIWFCFLLFEGVVSLLLFPFLSLCFVFLVFVFCSEN